MSPPPSLPIAPWQDGAPTQDKKGDQGGKGTKRPATGPPGASGDSPNGPRGEAAGASGDPPKGPDGLTRGALSCTECTATPERPFDNLCPISIDDWQGRLPALCRRCFALKNPEQDFDAQAKRMWKARTKNLRQTLRIDSFQKSIVQNEPEPDEDKRSWRKRVMDNAMIIAATWYTSFIALPPEKQKALAEALSRYNRVRKAQADDPTFVPQLNCCGNLLIP